ncbi:MAG: hypothetical protein BA867_09635 [Desulfobacterales bacterium S5133MH16]|nr:MAG: hypothetical protein BA867_09635 [Desulfobacterales bacterium S5133MH16]
MKLTEYEQEYLEKFFDDGSYRVESEPEHWIHGGDEGFSYCQKCCEKEVKRLTAENPAEEYSVDGGWKIEGDNTPYCEKCGKLLENTLTDYGCEVEIDHFLTNGFDVTSDLDRRSMSEVISSGGWEPFARQLFKNEDERENTLNYFDDLHRLCRSILIKIGK